MRLQMPKLPPFKPRAEVGDAVYYISLNNSYAVKRATVVEIQHSGSEYSQLMSNRDVVVKDALSVEDNTKMQAERPVPVKSAIDYQN